MKIKWDKVVKFGLEIVKIGLAIFFGIQIC